MWDVRSLWWKWTRIPYFFADLSVPSMLFDVVEPFGESSWPCEDMTMTEPKWFAKRYTTTSNNHQHVACHGGRQDSTTAQPQQREYNTIQSVANAEQHIYALALMDNESPFCPPCSHFRDSTVKGHDIWWRLVSSLTKNHQMSCPLKMRCCAK